MKDLKTGSEVLLGESLALDTSTIVPLDVWHKFTSTSSGEEDEEDPDPLVEGEVLAHTTRSAQLVRFAFLPC